MVGANQPLGVIFDTNSKGRFDLLIYDDGFLGVRGNYVGAALLGAGAGMAAVFGEVGGGAAPVAGTAMGQTSPNGYRGKRIAKLQKRSREELLQEREANFWIARTAMTDVVLRKRWHGSSLRVQTAEGPVNGRVFSWKPALNNSAYVRYLSGRAFGDLLSLA